MASKNFEKINVDRTNTVARSIERATGQKGQQATASQEEAKARRESMKTQGRKGAKATRINMAFSDSNHEYIKIMARVTGQSMTEFTNYVIEQYRTEHPEVFEQAKAFISSL